MQRLVNHFFLSTAVILVSSSIAFAHIRIAPTESTAGAREKYTMRVPNEKQVSCSKIEVEHKIGFGLGPTNGSEYPFAHYDEAI